MTRWLEERAPEGLVIGLDISTAHLAHARTQKSEIHWIQADLSFPPLPAKSLDHVWCSNTINHLVDPVQGIRIMSGVLRSEGQLILAQSAFLPEMFFAWDARLERRVRQACYQYYRDKYGLAERDTTAVRSLLGFVKEAGFAHAHAKTHLIERTSPLSEIDQAYFLEVVFKGYWGEKIRPYLSTEDWNELKALTNPESSVYCLNRADFHHLQTITIVTARL